MSLSRVQRYGMWTYSGEHGWSSFGHPVWLPSRCPTAIFGKASVFSMPALVARTYLGATRSAGSNSRWTVAAAAAAPGRHPSWAPATDHAPRLCEAAGKVTIIEPLGSMMFVVAAAYSPTLWKPTVQGT